MNATSQPGGWNSTQAPGVSANEVHSSPALTTGYACTFQVGNNPVTVSSLSLANISGGNASVAWKANVQGSGWVQYYEIGVATNLTQTATVSGSGTNWWYHVQLHGLGPGSLFGLRATTGLGAGCLTYESGLSTTFNTVGQFQLTEMDLPYDSVSQQGGGAVLTWQLPANVTKATFYNGTVLLRNLTIHPATVQVPLTSQSQISYTPGFYAVNLTPTELNTSYLAQAFLNFTVTVGGQKTFWNLTSRPLTFVYQRDTSGDGLTDAEKLRGWWIPLPQVAGGTGMPGGVSWVTANPRLYATNGLVSDLIEKEFGLDPNTVDTAGSHMLDTWNLTFDLGANTSALKVPNGTNFRYWDERNAYDWTKACQYFVTPGQSCTLGSVGTDLSNLSGADSSPWAARVLWSHTALTEFVNLTGVLNAGWLRAVLGASGGHWTITVWGKLSWGANPLAASTPHDGLADGARVNPALDEALLISGLNASLGGTGRSCPIAPANGAYGWAALFYLNLSTPSGMPELAAGGNYSVAALDRSSDGSSNCGSLSDYQVPIPVNGSAQNQSLEIRLMLNQSSSPSQTILKPQAFSGGSTKVALLYDQFAARPRSYAYSGSNGTLSFSLSMVPSGGKTTTLLWLPTDNGTLNNLPWGLKRYTGEQAFDLVVVNLTASSSTTSDPIPYAQNASDHYSVTLTPGLNNLLFPRAQFLDSPLGQAVLLGSNTSWTNSSAKAPLLGTGENSTISSYGPMTNPLVDLACYWQNRAIYSSGGTAAPICHGTGGFGTEAGTANGSSASIVVVAATSGHGANSGGVPSNPALENASEAGAALQSVVQLNVSSVTELDLLLAALLDNTTGGVNGTFLPVAQQVPVLGLSPVVTQALANVTYSSGGLFGVPWGVMPPYHPPPCTSLWCDATNLVSGIVSVGGQFFSFVWSGVVALATFIDDHLPTWLRNAGAALLNRTAQALAKAGDVLAVAWDTLIEAVAREVQSLLNSALSGYYVARNASAQSVDSAVDPTGPEAVWEAIGGTVFQYGFVIAVAVQVVLGIVTAVTLGAGWAVNLLIGLILSFGLTALTYLMPQLGAPSAAMVNSCEAFASGMYSQTSQAGNWTSWANAFSYWETGTSTAYAFRGLQTAWSDAKSTTTFQFAAQAFSLAFALLASGSDFCNPSPQGLTSLSAG